jgi:cell division protein FtsN
VAAVSQVAAVPEVPVAASAPVSASTAITKAKPEVAEAGVYLQLGAFHTAMSAKKFLTNMHSKLGPAGKSLGLYQKNKLHQVLLGPYSTSKEALAAGKKLKAKSGIKTILSVRK